MKIAIDARMLSWSGIGRYTSRLLDELQQQDKTNQYVVLLGKSDFEVWQPANPNFQKQLAPFRPFSLAEQLGFCRLLYQLKADIVHFTNFNAPLLYLRRRVVTIHDLNMLLFHSLRGGMVKRLLSRFKRWPARLAFRCICMRSAAIFTPTHYVKNHIQNYFKHSLFRGRLVHKTHVTYEAADKLNAPPKIVKHLADKQFLLYVGNAYPSKNLEKLVIAFEKLHQQYPRLYLVLTGKTDSFYRQLAAEVRQRGTSHILLPGFASDAQLVWLYQNAVGFVTPSLAEGFGLPGLEAMQYGLPVMAAKASCLPEVYGEAAVYFDPTDPNDMAAVISRTLADTKLLGHLRQLGPKQASRYSWQQLAAQTLAIYRHSTKP